MTFTRVKELEAEAAKLRKKLMYTEVDRMMMEKFLLEKGLTDEYVKMAENEILDTQAEILRRRFKVVE